MATAKNEPLPEESRTPQTELDRLTENIDLNDPALSITFGAKTMDSMARFADSILEQVKAKNAGEIGKSLTELMGKVKSLDLIGLAQERGSVLSKIPLLGSLFNSAGNTLDKYKNLAEQVEVISGKLETAMIGLLRDIEVMEQLYQHNATFHADLNAHLAAGRKKLNEAETVLLPQAQEKALQESGTLAAQEVRDLADRIHRFERRLHDLELSQAITLQTAPQIRLIQNNDQTLAEKIQTSILTTAPIWKSQLVLAISLHNQRDALTMQKEVSNTTNMLLQKNAEMLETNSIETARQVEHGMVDLRTLQEVHKRLIHSIEETMNIAANARERRRETEKELEAMEGDLKEKLTALSAERTKAAMNMNKE